MKSTTLVPFFRSLLEEKPTLPWAQIWTAVAAIAAALSAMFSAWSVVISMDTAKDARDQIARNDAPVLFLNCSTNLSQHPSLYGWEMINDEMDIYIRLHKLADRFSVAILPNSYPECTLSNVGKLPATDVNLIFDVYYSEGIVNTTTSTNSAPSVHDVERVPSIESPEVGAINLAPGNTFSFKIWNASAVTAWFSSRLRAEIAIPTIEAAEKQCVPV